MEAILAKKLNPVMYSQEWKVILEYLVQERGRAIIAIKNNIGPKRDEAVGTLLMIDTLLGLQEKVKKEIEINAS